jgi:hypothetical protein
VGLEPLLEPPHADIEALHADIEALHASFQPVAKGADLGPKLSGETLEPLVDVREPGVERGMQDQDPEGEGPDDPDEDPGLRHAAIMAPHADTERGDRSDGDCQAAPLQPAPASG